MNSTTQLFYSVSLILSALGAYCLEGKSAAQMQEHYKKVAENLISIRKEHPTSQTKIYATLDQLDKLYSTAKQVSQKKQTFKKNAQDKIAENTALKQEIVGLRGDVSSIKKSVENAKNELAQKLAEEKIKTEQLSLERKDFLEKITRLEAEKKEHENKIDTKEADKEVEKISS